MTIILGVDPGLQNTGWGIIKAVNNNIKFIASGTIKTDKKQPISSRLSHIANSLVEITNQYTPSECAVEETFVNKNPMSSLKLGHARGAIILSLSQEGFIPYEYSATLVKKSVIGFGRGDKSQIVSMVKYILPSAKIDSNDAADALAIAICHHNHKNIRNY